MIQEAINRFSSQTLKFHLVLGFELMEKERLTIASEDASTDHSVMSPWRILRRLESDKLKTAPEAMDEIDS